MAGKLGSAACFRGPHGGDAQAAASAGSGSSEEGAFIVDSIPVLTASRDQFPCKRHLAKAIRVYKDRGTSLC